jgi:regulatory protein
MGDGGPADVGFERAMALAVRALNRRERTRAEMLEHLLGRDIEPEAVEAALTELAHQGYLDDSRFARMFVEDKRSLEQWGVERIRRELAARGVGRDHVQTALGGDAPDDELDRARALLRRRFPDGPRDRRERERALAVLLRKGYEYDLAAAALAEASSS